MKTKWYLHNSHCTDEIEEQLSDWGVSLSPEALENLANEIRDKFYEIGFDVEYDKSGKILSIAIEK
jgi:hypothetical protein